MYTYLVYFARVHEKINTAHIFQKKLNVVAQK
jgi:phage-related protein